MSDRPRKGFRPDSDQEIANDYQADQQLMCVARGCPNRWSLASTRACTAHSWADSSRWPAITDEQLALVAQMAYQAGKPKAPPKPVDRDALRVAGGVMASNLSGTAPLDGKAWARRLRQRERDGANLTQYQRDAWRIVLGNSLREEQTA